VGTVYKAKTKRAIPSGARIEEKRGQRYAVWMGRHGKECRHKLTAEGNRIIYESDFYTVEFSTGKNRHREVTGFRDRDSAKTYLYELENRAEKRRTGMLDSRLEAYEAHARRPIAEHVADFLAVKRAKDKTPKHIASLKRHLDWMITEIRAKTLADISATQVTLAVGRMKDAGTSLRTCNSYLTSMKVFVNWCLLDGRLHEDVLLVVTAYDHATDPRHPRRAPSVDEIHRLLDTARSRSEEQCDFFGEDRAMAYETSFLTGFRASEIRSLTPEDYDVEGEHPCITVRPRNSKRRRLDIQPLPGVAVARFSTWLAGKPSGRRIFEKMPRDTARMLRADLAIARAAWIAEAETPDEKRHREASDFLKYENSVGEFFDFHACRHGYITLISETCKSLKQAQTLARVSTPKLLDRYSHIQLHGMQQAADAIGQMLANGGTRQPGRRREAAATPLTATGTDDEKPAPASRSIRGASRGSSPASGGRTWQTVAGWEACDAPDSEQTEQPASDPKTKKPLRRPLLSAHRRGFRSRGSGRSRTDDGGFAIRCLSHLATEPFQSRSNQPPHTATLRQDGAFGQAVPVALT
jgi:integrase